MVPALLLQQVARIVDQEHEHQPRQNRAIAVGCRTVDVPGLRQRAKSHSGDNGPAPSAQLTDPQAVAVDSTGNLYLADTGNNRILKVTNGVITWLRETASKATAATMVQP